MKLGDPDNPHMAFIDIIFNIQPMDEKGFGIPNSSQGESLRYKVSGINLYECESKIFKIKNMMQDWDRDNE